MSNSNWFENQWLLHIYNNENIAGLGDASGVLGSATAGNVFIALHASGLDDTNLQDYTEISYTGYARSAQARTSGVWTVSGNQVTNVSTVNFPTCTGGSATASGFSVGITSGGSTNVLHYGILDATFPIASGNTPTFGVGAFVITLD